MDQQNPQNQTPPAPPQPEGQPVAPEVAQAMAEGARQAATGGQQPATDQDYTQLKAELEQNQSKLQEMVQISQHALADLQNFKRRTEEEKAAFITYANAALLMEMLPVIDNVNRALQHEPKDAEWSKGVEQTLKQFVQTLEKIGLKTIPTVGQKFDPRLHEALLTAPGEKDTVLEELEKGYLLGDKVLKPARVKVGNGETAK